MEIQLNKIECLENLNKDITEELEKIKREKEILEEEKVLSNYNKNLIIDNILKNDINYQFEEIDEYDLVENTINTSYVIKDLTSDEIALFYLNFKNNTKINYNELFRLSAGVIKIEVGNDS